MIRIGPAGNSESFTAMGYKSTPQIPEYLEKMGLNAYEYQCGRGVRINREGVLKLKAGCEARDIQLSLHAPYYISLSSVEEEKRQNSIKYILESAEAADLMGARRIVVHSGSCAKISREEALSLAGETLKQMRPTWGTSSSARRLWASLTSWARWRRSWSCASWMTACCPASISATSMPARWVASAGRRTTSTFC